jgi:hypothetical protein
VIHVRRSILVMLSVGRNSSNGFEACISLTFNFMLLLSLATVTLVVRERRCFAKR